jgi:site-specific recombinase XerD
MILDVLAYKAHLEAAGRSTNVRLCALRKLVSEAADNGLIPMEVAAAIARVRGVAQRGVRLGNWLDRRQAERLLRAPPAATLTGKRDRALFAVLLGCGLRGSEAVCKLVEQVVRSSAFCRFRIWKHCPLLHLEHSSLQYAFGKTPSDSKGLDR